ncbi:hypothetical protein RSOLAG22IIIB_09481 [Rhizoctonia solani]|uniref:Uncharacterized protein n=1 Tax=Rhizoctonia solani TaxID=456999 RepID=A0A0K6FYT5_9AGAM|nr:hypothetical protein RSOLAG22IIIB_09481 [Rhizoctonia solani]
MAQDTLRLFNTLAQTNFNYMRQKNAFRTRNFARGWQGAVQLRHSGPPLAYQDRCRRRNQSLEGSEVDLDEGISNHDLSVDVFELLLGPLALRLPPGLLHLGACTPALPTVQVLQEAAAQASPLLTTLPPDPYVPDGYPAPRNAPVLTRGPFPLCARELGHNPDPGPCLEAPDPMERLLLNPALRPIPDPNMRGLIGLQTNNLSVKLSRAIRLFKNVISVTETLNDRVKRTHQCIIDCVWDIMEDISRLTLRVIRIEDEPRIRDPTYPRKLLKWAYPTPLNIPDSTDSATTNTLLTIVEKLNDTSALCSVEAPESSVDGTEGGLTSGSERRSKSTKTKRRDNAVVTDVTYPVARWRRRQDAQHRQGTQDRPAGAALRLTTRA